jgi:hypothetical protein
MNLRGLKSKTHLVKEEKRDLLANSHNILHRYKNYFCQLLKVHEVSDIRNTEMQTAKPLVPEPSFLMAEIAIKKLKRYKYPCTDKITAELI